MMTDQGGRALSRLRLFLTAGTYDGVLAGWELSDEHRLSLTFATPVHQGSIRSVSAAAGGDGPGLLLSTGYDEMLHVHQPSRGVTCVGQVRTPADYGTPLCSALAPPADRHPTHCLTGFSSPSGKLVLYRKRDWSVVHVMEGHAGGVSSVAVHPSGKMALTGGARDGTLKLWDLQMGKLAHTQRIDKTKTQYHPSIVSIVWKCASVEEEEDDDDDDVVSSPHPDVYAYGYGSHVAVVQVDTGQSLLDVELPSTVNQLCLLSGKEGLFVAAACNDGSLPVLEVGTDGSAERRAIMAVEPVDGPAGEERFKCIQSVGDYYVVTANSAGVVSLMNLQGAVNMIVNETDDDDGREEERDAEEDGGSIQQEEEQGEDDVELAVDIIDSARLGTGARITCLAAWSSWADDEEPAESSENKETTETTEHSKGKKRKHQHQQQVVMDPAALEKARDLV
jgi:WD40 repeat protein